MRIDQTKGIEGKEFEKLPPLAQVTLNKIREVKNETDMSDWEFGLLVRDELEKIEKFEGAVRNRSSHSGPPRYDPPSKEDIYRALSVLRSKPRLF